MRDYEAKTNMTNTGLEKRRPNSEEPLPVVLLHGNIRTVRRLVAGSRTAEEAPPGDSPKLC